MICPYCGKVDTATEGTRCSECQARYNTYMYLKRKLQEHPSNETSEQLQAIINGYKGYSVKRGTKQSLFYITPILAHEISQSGSSC